jgi:hypothetical protein
MEEPSPSRHRRRERRRRRAAQGAPTAAVEPTPADGTPAAADITVGTAAAAQDATGETAAAAQDATGETAAGQASAAAAAGQASAETAAVPAPGPKRKSRARRTDAERSLRGIVGAGSSQVGVVGAMRARDAARPTADDLAAAERDVVIVRRRYVPPDALPGAR